MLNVAEEFANNLFKTMQHKSCCKIVSYSIMQNISLILIIQRVTMFGIKTSHKIYR